jgi:outer membrane protein assembly factor BamB
MASVSKAGADNWPAWRGAAGQGVCAETDLPLKWSRTENVKWRSALPGPGNSTPIVWNDHVIITQATDGGRRRSTMCLHRRDGRLLWKQEIVFEKSEATHGDNPYCSASPVTDGERVIVSHGSAGVFCYDLQGKELWRRDFGPFDHIWGNASSPVIHEDLCFLNCGPGENTFLVALKKQSGETVWRRPIDGGYRDTEAGQPQSWTGSWSTPLIVSEGGREMLLISYPHTFYALTAEQGELIWSSGGLGKLVYTSPLAAAGVAVAMSGFMGPFLALRTGGQGDVTETHRLWRFERGKQRIGSGVIYAGHLYTANDDGTAECLDLKTGKAVWQERLGGQIWSSLVLSGDRLYTADRRGQFFVFRAAPKFELLAKNDLGEVTRASIAVSNGELFLRTYENLWCIHSAKTP